MMLVDTNVLLDIVTDDPLWAAWSAARLALSLTDGLVAINDVVYAELSVRFAGIDEVDATIGEVGLVVDPIPREALFVAGKAFQAYRRAGGVRTGVLPDFFIGAHAVARGWPLLTRDPARYRTYFPTLALVSPD
ncbi:type II toxin-antitoxin system VapC family toxin [Phreatobacter sp.]|uniref:type II toxin-antitoxin system VapC family toxin n=1 Tax=Phreatobacter sp. TaxID=1966341 RepID=UPI0022C10452|nr:type II toxin-antitoxin system VapC family toxin [Phreatobacter sp.]MCZ8316530.1 type II toxin-antitoxin system VapC family toxin [Phreatobacter sp.]